MSNFTKETTIIVSRHAGAVEWLHQNGVPAAVPVVEQVDDPSLLDGKIVIGNLPPFLNERAKEFWTIDMRLPREARGQELSPADMDMYGATLTKVRRVKDVEEELKQAQYLVCVLANAALDCESAAGADLLPSEIRELARQHMDLERVLE